MRRAVPLLAVLAATGAYAAHAPVVKAIKVVGLRWTKKEFVLRELLLRPGEPFSEKKLKESIRNLLNTHLFYSVKAEVLREKGGVVVVIRVKEKFPVVPLPRFRLKSDGSYRAGLEIRDYNLLGMGNRLFVGFTKWFNTQDESDSQFVKVRLYRVAENVTFDAGVYRSSSVVTVVDTGRELGKTRVETISTPVSALFYLDPTKVHKFSFGVSPTFTFYNSLLSDKRIYYLNGSYELDRTTDMVYYTVGSRSWVSVSYAAPVISDLTTGAVSAGHFKSFHLKGTRTFNYSLVGATKVGFSGAGYKLSVPIEGYRGEAKSFKRYLLGTVSYRFPVIDRSVYAEPTLQAGVGANNSPEKLLTSVGVSLTAFWAKLADGIIRFKLFRGLGSGGTLKTSFRLTVRW